MRNALGSSIGGGAESFRRNSDQDQATALSIMAIQDLMDSFTNRAESLICRDITQCDFSSALSTAKYMLLGRFITCFNLAEAWAPEAIQSADNSLSFDPVKQPQQTVSCATEVAKRMGASGEERVMVAGFAGGLGLSGNACGALAAAIWLNTLPWCEEHTKTAIFNSNAASILERFYVATNHEILCQKISGRSFKTMEDHAEFIRGGGCNKLINLLAQSL
ncbi:MAG: C-GCAxxG-C-C family protein [Candidatus Polarisedimenticolaceae bacterium]|nr:C-GCAxxG-C-C family protein [Candidatus Polarisedimenticolaceae bacterium]